VSKLTNKSGKLQPGKKSRVRPCEVPVHRQAPTHEMKIAKDDLARVPGMQIFQKPSAEAQHNRKVAKKLKSRQQDWEHMTSRLDFKANDNGISYHKPGSMQK